VSFIIGVAFVVVWDPLLFAAPIATPTQDPSKEGWAQATPGYTYRFPRDHGSHNEYGLEWWYCTGHLSSHSDRRFGYELTFFRKGVHQAKAQAHASRWGIQHLYFAHLALTDVHAQTFRFAEKLSRAGLGKAGAHRDRMEVWIDDWSLKPLTLDHQVLSLHASEETFGLALTLTVKKPPVIHGENGISRKGNKEGQASHYYSLTRLSTKGQLVVESQSFEVSGLSWMDHEFGSGAMGDNQVGWDWFSLQFDSGAELMVYLLRRSDGSSDPASSGTWISPDGKSEYLHLGDISIQTQNYWVSPHTNARYPAEWTLAVPSVQLRVHVKPLFLDQELRTSKSTQVTYWEGAVEAIGHHGGDPIQGQGYVELTGYAQPLTMDGK